MNMLRILTSSQTRALESAWIKQCHNDWGLVLMELAGIGASKMLLELMEGMPAAITVICGRGNNGGDGLVLARHLHLAGLLVNVFLVEVGKGNNSYTHENEVNRQILESLGVTINFINDKNVNSVQESIAETSAVVDALLGTGIDREVEGVYAKLINLINESERPVLSIDLPSGINSDSGQIMGTAVYAAATATFGSIKPGLLSHPGAELAGEIRIIDIGLPMPEALPEPLLDSLPQLDIPRWWLITAEDLQDKLPARALDTHKGNYGQVLIVSGSLGMSGSSLLASRASLRSGAGIAILATPRSTLLSLPPEEIIYRPLAETSEGSISLEALSYLEAEMNKADVMLIGPGLSTNEDTIKFIHELLKKVRVPCVLDADGLNALSQNTKILAEAEGAFIFTPHPKELARLTGKSTKEIQSNRIRAAQDAAKRFGATIVLKGAHSVVATPDDDVYIIPTGNPGMATAGSGDVLSGIIAGLLGQGLNRTWAAVVGTYIHGASGDMVAAEKGEQGIIASDLIDYLPHVISLISEGSYPGSSLEQSLMGNNINE